MARDATEVMRRGKRKVRYIFEDEEPQREEPKKNGLLINPGGSGSHRMDEGLPENSNRQHSQSNSDSSQNSERDQNSGESGNTPVH